MDAPGKLATLGIFCLLAGCGAVNENLAQMGLSNPFGGPAGAPALRTQTPPPAPVDDWSAANFAAWSPQTPDYLLYPGDQISIAVPSAPELSGTFTIGPDGRFSFPYVGAVMAANRTAPEVSQSLTTALGASLRRPYVEVSSIGFASQQVLVMGEVAQPGMYELRGPMGALEAVAMAGGFSPSANRGDVWIVRRASNGLPMRRQVNLGAELRGVNGGDYDVLARYDIVYVPRSGLASAGAFVQQLAQLVPVNFGFSYALNGDGNNNDINAFASTP